MHLLTQKLLCLVLACTLSVPAALGNECANLEGDMHFDQATAFREAFKDVTEHSPTYLKFFQRLSQIFARRIVAKKCVQGCTREEYIELAKDTISSITNRNVGFATGALTFAGGLGITTLFAKNLKELSIAVVAGTAIWVGQSLANYSKGLFETRRQREVAATLAGFDPKLIWPGLERVTASLFRDATFNSKESALDWNVMRPVDWIKNTSKEALAEIEAGRVKEASVLYAELLYQWTTVHPESLLLMYHDRPATNTASAKGTTSYQTAWYLEAMYKHFYKPLLADKVITRNSEGVDVIRSAARAEGDVDLVDFRKQVSAEYEKILSRNSIEITPKGKAIPYVFMLRTVPKIERWEEINTNNIKDYF